MSLLLHVRGSALALHYVAPSLEVPISGFIFTAERVFVVLVEPLGRHGKTSIETSIEPTLDMQEERGAAATASPTATATATASGMVLTMPLRRD